MQELSMNVLDIAQNSVAANASLIEIEVEDKQPFLILRIIDDGKGMSKDMLEKVTDPFCTTRKTRKVGLGLPFFKMAAEMTGGTFSIESEVGKGTKVVAQFMQGHIDLMPLGDMAQTIAVLVQANPNINFVYTYSCGKDGEQQFCLDTRQVREILQGVPLSEPSVVLFIKEYIEENEKEISLIKN